jgi:hypothetical protein
MLGRRRARLTIDLDRLAQSADIAIPLDAIATDPALIVTTPDADPDDYALDFGVVDLDDAPKLANVTLHNATARRPSRSRRARSPAIRKLTIASACPFTIAPDTSAELAIAFAPTAEVESTAILTLTGTGFATGALQLPLRGTGIDVPPAGGGGCGPTAPAHGLALSARPSRARAPARRRRARRPS